MSTSEGTSELISAETRLAYDDLPEAVESLCRAFGFHERVEDRLQDPDADGFTATWVEIGDTTLMLGRTGDHGLASPTSLSGSSAMIVVTVADVDAHCEAARAAGADVVTDLHTVPWGFRRYEALDLEGHRWHFMEHVAP